MVIRIVECARLCSKRRGFIVHLHGTEIDVTVTANASVAKKWISSTLYLRRHELHHFVVGLGVQWTPGGSDSPADTLQLCVGRRCLIFQLAHADFVPNVLRQFLSDRRFTFVGFYNHSDRQKLMISKHRLKMVRDPLDLRLHVESEDDESLMFASVEDIVKECLGFDGVRLRREISTSDWDDEFLSDDQVLQACLDAHCAFEIGKNIRAWRISRAGRERIIEKCLGFEGVSFSEEIGNSEWDSEFLSHEQVLHACLDAYCAFEIGKNIRAWEFTS